MTGGPADKQSMPQHRRLPAVIVVLFAALLMPSVAAAQSVALGPRFSLVRGDLASETPTTRLVGGTLRMRSSSFTTLELAMDYRTTRSEDRTEKVRETPMQASLIVMPFRSVIAPYALGGIGVYSRKVDVLDPDDVVMESSLTRKVGWHAGFGAELRLGRHAALFADYRYQFVKFKKNDNPEDDSIIPGLNRLQFSHQGSMWTGGFAFYF